MALSDCEGFKRSPKELEHAEEGMHVLALEALCIYLRRELFRDSVFLDLPMKICCLPNFFRCEGKRRSD